jgi:hypothetical protein
MCGVSDPSHHIRCGLYHVTQTVHKGMKIKVLTKRAHQIIGSYLICSSSHLPLGDFNETVSQLFFLLSNDQFISQD